MMPSKRRRAIDPADLDAFIAAFAAERLFRPTTVAQLADLLAANGVSESIFVSGNVRVRLGLLLAKLRDRDLGGYVIRLADVDRHSKQRLYVLGTIAADGRNDQAPFIAASTGGGDFPDW